MKPVTQCWVLAYPSRKPLFLAIIDLASLERQLLLPAALLSKLTVGLGDGA